MQKERYYFSADAGVIVTFTGVGVSGQMQPSGKY
jgi:hypothetical protein